LQQSQVAEHTSFAVTTPGITKVKTEITAINLNESFRKAIPIPHLNHILVHFMLLLVDCQ
jgi:hypothetical protein